MLNTVETKLKDTLFEMQTKIDLLEYYKTNYHSLGEDIHNTKQRIENYMNSQAGGLTDFMKKADETMVKLEDRTSKLESNSLDHKFGIDRLQAKMTQQADLTKKVQAQITKLFEETRSLDESKTDQT